MKPSNLKTRAALRASRHRKRMASSGARRVEVTIPSHDVPLVKALADVLRSDGAKAELIRKSLHPVLTTSKAKTGAGLVAFLRASPLIETELPIERDRTTGRTADFG